MIFDNTANTILFGDALPESGIYGQIFLNMTNNCLYTFNTKWIRLNNDSRYDLHLFFGELPTSKHNTCLFFMKMSRQITLPKNGANCIAYAEFFDGAFELSIEKNNIEIGTVIFSQNEGNFSISSESFSIGDELKILVKSIQRNKLPPRNISLTFQTE